LKVKKGSMSGLEKLLEYFVFKLID